MTRYKKYMIRCDVEGASGVVSYEQVVPGKPEYGFGLSMFKSDLCACIEGLRNGGAGEIVVYDEHYYGRNIDPGWLPEDVSVIAGKPPYRADWAGGLDGTFAGVIMLGLHSKYGTPGGLLHHSYELDIRDLNLNGVSVGEIGMEAAVAGDCGVPVILVTGDSAGCKEAEDLIPGVRTVAVKESLGETGARCFPLSETVEAIRKAAEKAVIDPPSVQPYSCAPDVTLIVRFNPGQYADTVRRTYAEDLNESGDLVLRGASASGVWADYWLKKLEVQKHAE